MPAEAEQTPAPAPGRLPLMGGLLAGAVVLVDQLVKAWALYLYELPVRGRVELSPIMDLTMVWNRGISFGLFQADSALGRWFFTLFSLIVAGLLAVWLARAHRWMLAVALGLVIGGAVGNAIDRAFRGAVADFLDFSDVWFPWVFNIADAGISVGVALLLLDAVLTGDKPRQ